MTTHKEAMDYVRKEFNKACWTDGVTLSGSIEAAIRAYLDARGLVMVPKMADADMLADGMDRYARHDDAEEDVDCIYRAMLAAAPDPFK